MKNAVGELEKQIQHKALKIFSAKLGDFGGRVFPPIGTESTEFRRMVSVTARKLCFAACLQSRSIVICAFNVKHKT
jgi:hypothetical protein